MSGLRDVYPCVSAVRLVVAGADAQIPFLVRYHSGGTHHAGQIRQDSTYTVTILYSSSEGDPSDAQSQRRLSERPMDKAECLAHQATLHEGLA